MKEMIERLIADGWEWVVKNKHGESCFVYNKKPFLNKNKSAFECEDKTINKLLPCLFPDITFENSPVELKTLLIDDEGKKQKRLKELSLNYDYFAKDIENRFIVVSEKGNYTTLGHNDTALLIDFCPNHYEKVYLKDLVKKRKVRKSVWLHWEEKGLRIHDSDNLDESEEFLTIEFNYIEDFELRKGDKPIELTYEVEE